MGVVMKKYVVCRIVDTAPSPASDTERPHYQVFRKASPTAPPAELSTETDESEPQPVFGVLQSFIDRAYGVRSAKSVRIGRLLNLAV